MMDDLIKRHEAIDALDKEYRCTDHTDDWDGLKTAMLIIENLPSAQPEPSQVARDIATIIENEKDMRVIAQPEPKITDEQAIEHLQSSGWMQNHDKQMYEMGAKEQPQRTGRCKDCLMHGVCRFEQGLGLDGYCSQWQRMEENNESD